MSTHVIASLNLPGQDVKNGHRLLRRPVRYRKAAAMLNTLGVGVVALQETTYQAREVIDTLDNWTVSRGPVNNRMGGVANAIAWRSDRYKRIDVGYLGLKWPGAEKGYLYIPWVQLEDRRTGVRFTVYSVHLPTRWVAATHVRDGLRFQIAQHARRWTNWVAPGDYNDTISAGYFKRVGGRESGRHGVDTIVTSKTFRRRRVRGFRAVVQGVMWRISDHPLVLVRGKWAPR